MFDLTAETIDRPFRDSHVSTTVLSIVAHVTVLGSIAWVVVFSVSDTLPEVPTMIAFVAEAPVPSTPPPPPPPAAKAAHAAQVSKPVPTRGPTFTVPTEIPVGIQPERGIDLSDEGGEVGGVEGGIPGGVLGGMLGGMINEAPPPPPPTRPTRVGGELQPPALIHRVEPDYPVIAVAGKISGTVVLEATVNESGAVADVHVLRSIPLLDQAAIKAVKQWRYQPLVLNGQPVPFILVVTVTFSLR
ncbi:MAG TPA: energy transducer TonB [Vicinamibacterales bacterium]|nr:energy transducer TonB [Vicinamibacterales bacterium]